MIKKVVCGISGGVDSAVAAYLLKRRGLEVVGVFMRNWDRGDEGAGCSADEDEEDATLVCKQLDIPLQKVDFVKEYWNEVFSHFVSGYTDGLTPNPDVLCNKHIKFGHFHHHCLQHLGADAVATGHYANNSCGQFGQYWRRDGKARLLRARDQTKDQTLFLSQISQASLHRSIFPLGQLRKVEVKEIAGRIGLHRIANKKESTGICFIGRRDFKAFISQYQSNSKGPFVDLETGNVVGEHNGVHQYTKGQRTSIGGLRRAYFVVSRDPSSQTIYVVPGSNHSALFSSSLLTSHPHWICDDPFRDNLHQATLGLQFRFQHTHLPIDCQVTQLKNDAPINLAVPISSSNGSISSSSSSCDSSNRSCINGSSGNSDVRLHIELSKVLRAIAPGQYATLYRGQECLGSAVILKMPLPSIPVVIQADNLQSIPGSDIQKDSSLHSINHCPLTSVASEQS